MLAILGAVGITLILGYVALVFGFFSACCLMGFDEVDIPAGIKFGIVAVGMVVLWWFAVGQNIHINFSG